MDATILGLGALAVIAAGAARRIPAAEIIGHRGAAHDAPENTVASIKLAWEQNADAVEIDVRLTADGRIVSFHDIDTKRIGGRDKPVAAQTLAELQTLDAGAWKGAKWAGERIATLADVLATIPDGKRLFIEIKCGPEVLKELARVLAAAGKTPKQTVLIGFSLETMAAAKRALPALQVCWVVELERNPQTGRWEPPAAELISGAKRAGLDGIDVGMCAGVDGDFVAEVKQAGLGFYTWTVDSAEDARKLAAWGADGITTNRPGWLREQLSKKQAP